MANPNATLDQVLSTTFYTYRKQITDQIFRGTRALNALRQMGVEVQEDSGAQLITPVQYAKGQGQWMSEYDTLSLAPVDIISSAAYDWKLLGGAAAVSDLELVRNQGTAGIIKLARAKVANVVDTLTDLLNTALYSDGSDPKQPAGLQAIANTSDPSAGALGGIGRAANTFWQGFKNTSAVALAVTDIVSGHLACTQGNDEPDIYLTSQHLAAAYEALVQGKQQIYNMAKGDAGISDLYFKGGPVVWDAANPAGMWFFLTTRNFAIYTVADKNFQVEAPERKVDQFVSIHKVSFFGQVVSYAPRTFGVLTSRT